MWIVVHYTEYFIITCRILLFMARTLIWQMMKLPAELPNGLTLALRLTQVPAVDKLQRKRPFSTPRGTLVENHWSSSIETDDVEVKIAAPAVSRLKRCKNLAVGRVNRCWPSPAQSFLVPSPEGLMTIIYSVTTLGVVGPLYNDWTLGRKRTSPYHYNASLTFRNDNRKWSAGGRMWHQEPELPTKLIAGVDKTAELTKQNT
jgi:hypothetical protein